MTMRAWWRRRTWWRRRATMRQSSRTAKELLAP
jgi:hypothetical protein